MAKKFDLIDELVTANRILANEGIVDSSATSACAIPRHKDRYLLSRARAPDGIEPSTSWSSRWRASRSIPEGQATHAPYTRTLHPRRDLRDAARDHVGGAQPFAEHDPVRHHQHQAQAAAAHVRVDRPRRAAVDSHDKFGDTALLVNSMAMGRDLAQATRQEPHRADARTRRCGGRHLDPPTRCSSRITWSWTPSCKCKRCTWGRSSSCARARSTP